MSERERETCLSTKAKRTKSEQTEISLRLLAECCKGLSSPDREVILHRLRLT